MMSTSSHRTAPPEKKNKDAQPTPTPAQRKTSAAPPTLQLRRSPLLSVDFPARPAAPRRCSKPPAPPPIPSSSSRAAVDLPIPQRRLLEWQPQVSPAPVKSRQPPVSSVRQPPIVEDVETTPQIPIPLPVPFPHSSRIPHLRLREEDATVALTARVTSPSPSPTPLASLTSARRGSWQPPVIPRPSHRLHRRTSPPFPFAPVHPYPRLDPMGSPSGGKVGEGWVR